VKVGTIGTVLRFDDPLPVRPRRVLVAGVSGVGKTSLARRIAEIIDAPHTEIDGLYHGTGWVPREHFLDDVRTLIAQESWATEWQYATARPLLAERADLVIWLDLPFATVTLPRVVRRTLRRRLRREILWNGNMEPPLHTILTDREHIVRWAISTRNTYRTRVPALERDHPHLTVARLTSPRQVDSWLRGPLANAVR
jgi:adenylate kinase family enzyme